MSDRTTTVVVPTIGRPELLARCLKSVLAGDCQPDQVIVCDQSSDDRTAEVVGSMQAGDLITYLRLPVPAASAARNAGITSARSDLVAFIDDDCVAAPPWLAMLVDAYARAAAGEEVAGVAGAVRPLRSTAGRVPVSSRVSSRRRAFRALHGQLERGVWAPWDVGTGANLLSPRRTLLSIGGFDTSLGPGTPADAAEDVDLLFRLARVGTLLYEPSALVFHPATTRRGRLASRIRYGRGMGAMLARRTRAGDPAARALSRLYVRHQVAESFRTGWWGPIESGLTLVGFAPALAGVLPRGGRSAQESRSGDG
jgi:glycosyltransferase involved in cell wall biosynthesis